MRLVLDTLVALMVTGILAGVVMMQRQDRVSTEVRDFVRYEVSRFQRQVTLQSALKQVELADSGYPLEPQESWFGGNTPSNDLLGPNHPWVDVARGEELKWAHPRHLTAAGVETAGFWYNPARGIVRARVPQGLSDREDLDLYNFVNETRLDSVFRRESKGN